MLFVFGGHLKRQIIQALLLYRWKFIIRLTMFNFNHIALCESIF